MPPEEVQAVVAVRLDIVNGVLAWKGERVFPMHEVVKASWYTSPKAGPHDYLPILGGVVYVHKPSISGVPVRFDDLQITKVADRHKWRDNAGEGGLMFVLVLPPGYGIIAPKPMPIEGKKFDDRLALFWLLFPPFEGDSSSVIAEWSLGTFTGELDREVERVNRMISLALKRGRSVEYDVALSFAGEDRPYVEEVAKALRDLGVKCFYDDFEQANLWGKNLYDHLDDIYRKQARFTVMFISKQNDINYCAC